MTLKHLRTLSACLLPIALLAPGIIARTNHAVLPPTVGLMHVDVTYTEEAQITDKTKNDNGAEAEDVSSFGFRATATFEQRVMMQPIAGAGLNFYPAENARQKFSGGVSYNGELKRTGLDE